MRANRGMNTAGTPSQSAAVARGYLAEAGIGAIGIIAANAGLVFLYFAYDLTLYQLVLVYWWECLWIGLFCALKLIVASVAGDPYSSRRVDVSPGASLLLSVVAIGFVALQFTGIFLLSGFAIGFAYSALTGIDAGELMFNEIGLIVGSSALLLAGHALSFVANFLVGGEFRHARAGTLLALPFRRCLALLATIAVAFAAAATVPGLANAAAFGVLLMLLKLVADYRLHRAERRALAGTDTRSP